MELLGKLECNKAIVNADKEVKSVKLGVRRKRVNRIGLFIRKEMRMLAKMYWGRERETQGRGQHDWGCCGGTVGAAL